MVVDGEVPLGEDSPSFQLYPRDLLADTHNLTDAAFGLYVRLLCAQWLNGSLPAAFESEDDESMTDVLPIGDLKERRKGWRVIERHFPAHPELVGRVAQPRLERIRAAQKTYRASQAAKSAKGVRRRQELADAARTPDQPAGKPVDQPVGIARVNPDDDLRLTSAIATAIAIPTGTSSPPVAGEGEKDRSGSPGLEFGVWFLGAAIGSKALPDAWSMIPGSAKFAYEHVEASIALIASYGVTECKSRARRMFERTQRTDVSRWRSYPSPTALNKHWTLFGPEKTENAYADEYMAMAKRKLEALQ
jgi:uncharacterized protein YdaU (DUF1376 family)